MSFACNINLIGSWASIIGVVISLGTLLYACFIDRKLKNLAKKFLFNTRSVTLKEDMEQSNSKISNLLKDYSRSKLNIKTELSICKASINSLFPKLPSENQQQFKKLKRMINSILSGKLVDRKDNRNSLLFCRKRKYDKEDVWNVYNEIAYSIKILENLIKDKRIL